MHSRIDIARMAGKLNDLAEAVMNIITSLPPEVQSKCYKQTAKLVDLMVRIEGVMKEVGAKDA